MGGLLAGWVGLWGGMFVQGLRKEWVNLGGSVWLVLTGWGALMAVCPRVWDSKMPAGICPELASLHSCGVAPGLPCPRSVPRWVSWGRGSPFLLGCSDTGIALQEGKEQPRVPGDCLAWPGGIFPSAPCCSLCLQGLGICGDTMPSSSGAWRSEEQLGCCCCEVLRSLLSQKPACLALRSAPKSPLALKEPFFSRKGEGRRLPQ